MIKKLLLFLVLISIAGCSVPSKGLNIYFYDKEGKLISVTRELPTIENPVTVAIDQLLKGPTEQDAAKGIVTRIPAGTRARNVEVEGEVAIINFNSALSNIKGGNKEVNEVLAQIISTATSVKGIKQVILKLQGSDQFTLGSEEYLIDHPLEKSDIKI